MAKLDNNLYVITGGSTDTGAPVYLTADQSWVGTLAEALVLDEAQHASALQQAAASERVVSDPYAIPVVMKNNEIDPLTTRERIRAGGPTTRVRRPD